jgi:hypothetical protein
MSSDCNHKNPLHRSGVNQYERVLQALLPNHAKVDERDHADLILFAKNYASRLKYFNASNDEDGDWQVFMSMDVSVTLASLVKLDIQGCFAYVKKIFDTIKSTDAGAVTVLQKQFKSLFDAGFTITTLLNEHYNALPDDFEFKTIIGGAVQSQLQPYYDRLEKYYDEAITQGIVNATETFSPEAPPVKIRLSQHFDKNGLADIWFDSSPSGFSGAFNGATTAVKIKNTGTHNLFTGIFDQYLKTLARLVEQASQYLDKTLSDFPAHTPHYGLYLSFIKLFRYAQDHQNNFSKRHLDLYYKEILRLKNKDAVADKVHLTFELAKAVENHLVEKGTVFKAGKDVDGLEIYYALTEDAVFNKGTVKGLKSIFVDRDITHNTLQVLANPVANSEDGLGGKLLSSDKSWKTFGDDERTLARIGFVIASDYLYLTEGKRTITFSFYAPAGDLITFDSEDVANRFALRLSGKKGWVDVLIDPSKVAVHASREYFTITASLDGGEQAIVPYSAKLHQHNLATTMPVAMFTVNDALAKESLWNFSVERIGIDVSVTGMKNVTIQNDTGTLSTSKPFDLFGAAPHVGSSFIIGSKEVFMKTLQPSGDVKATVNLTWDNYSDMTGKIASEDTHKVDIYHLQDSVWDLTQSNLKLFQDNRPDLDFVAPADMLMHADTFSFLLSTMSTPGLGGIGTSNPGLVTGPAIDTMRFVSLLRGTSRLSASIPQLDVAQDYSDNEPYTAKSTWGFLKIELNTDFGHGTYAQRLADAAKGATITSVTESSTTTTTIAIAPVEEPYTPKVKELSIDYSASTVIDFTSGEEGAYIHLTPFGSKDLALVSDRTLLPDVSHEGELFIGIDNFIPDQTLSILFQVAEGSADPLSVKQEMTWYYLGENNMWVQFNKEDLSDATNDLTQSGIITFSIPGNAVNVNTLMTDQLHWLRATVREKTAAVCKLIEVTAQAAVAEFTDYKGSGNYFKNALPANTISKLVVSEAAIKKITQPYASFGGKTRERDDHFYVRVSERLRHKNRSIAVWDYERMVLEAYPQIYKVKCINHTQILEKTSGTQTYYVDHELKPGAVLVVPVPDLQNQNAYDLLRPYTSLGLLTEIKKYLCQHISPHVNLDVRNPRFEEIQLDFKVKFVTDDNEFYKKQLKEELDQFLAPWAYNPETDIEFGGKISKSMLIDFIEERPYVDFLSCVKMHQIVEGVRSGDIDEALATSARSVFVSVKADDVLNAHKISFISDKCDC